nr:uncharacterized protein LOC111510575 [Leptinotarsa decemlineata]
MEDLQVVDDKVYQDFLQSDATEDELLADMTNCDFYKRKFAALKLQYEEIFRKVTYEVEHIDDANSECSHFSMTGRRFKLPLIEFKKFDGDIRNWLPFWSQFKKIHGARDIEAVDKIDYLIRATVPFSRARQLVESYPAIAENYHHIIEAMLSRFGREDLQIEVYVRELLKLVLCNATSKSKLELVILYDQIETQIRALDTLGITSDKCSAMLFPLIESCLPQDLLRAWQRSPHRFEPENSGSATNVSTESGPGKLDIRLKNLMKFLKTEVENEQRITLASEGFRLVGQGNSSANLSRTVSNPSAKKNVSSPVPTAANLVSFNSNCAFCGGSNHIGEHCFKAQKMSLEQKKRILISNKICFRCLKAGHTSKRCRGHPKCAICQKSHLVIMCPDLPSNKESLDTLDHSKKPEVNPNIDKFLATYNSRINVFLQTLRVNIFGANGSKNVRALIDSGSQ